ncbi:MAG: DeoR family transcriptional regulator [Patescibacteria group bacterium]
MKNQKDIEKTGMERQDTVRKDSQKSLLNKTSSEFINKKTEKLVTALYMITDCMDSGDALKGKLRGLGVDVLSDMHRLPILLPVERHVCITGALSRIGEILALTGIAQTIGFVSEMNGAILKKEFGFLVAELHSYQSESAASPFEDVLFENKKNPSFTLTEDMFAVDGRSEGKGESPFLKSAKDKRTKYNMSFMTPPSHLLSPISTKSLSSPHVNVIDKKERIDKIVSLIKDKKEVSIKDISGAFLNCSEKTIQRELNSLVSKGQIKKSGAKRWSRYSIA